MGCLKLTYRETYTALKVVRGGLYLSEKGCADAYRYGYNGQEKEIELNNSITSAEYWMYDGRLGRRWNIDPINYENLSPYSTFSNNPIENNDPDGLEPQNKTLLNKIWNGFLKIFGVGSPKCPDHSKYKKRRTEEHKVEKKEEIYINHDKNYDIDDVTEEDYVMDSKWKVLNGKVKFRAPKRERVDRYGFVYNTNPSTENGGPGKTPHEVQVDDIFEKEPVDIKITPVYNEWFLKTNDKLKGKTISVEPKIKLITSRAIIYQIYEIKRQYGWIRISVKRYKYKGRFYNRKAWELKRIKEQMNEYDPDKVRELRKSDVQLLYPEKISN